MGFLDHSTNNVIIDAVLTDRGRELLAKNDGSFRVVRYAFADDEVDYTVIKKYGRTIGKEKIEKNTPVFEAQTVASMALRYPLASYSDPNLVALPTLTLTSTLSTLTATSTSLAVTVKQDIASSEVTDIQRSLLQENTFQIIMDNRFLKIPSKTGTLASGGLGTDISYSCDAVTGGSALAEVSFTLGRVDGGSDYPSFQDSDGNVKTTIRIIGRKTGIMTTLEITVKY